MYIDFHTHAFDDKIAQRAIDNLVATSGFKPYTNGTVSDLKRQLKEDDIDRAVLLPIATKPTQQTVINDMSARLNSYEFICFGSVHPDASDAVTELERIKSLGLKGIKLHPDYQNFVVEDERMFPIYKKCEELGLIIVFHAGFDPLSPDFIHCKPREAAIVAKKFPDLKFVFAHLGGMNLFDEVYEHLAGLKNVWLDTAFLSGRIDDKLLTSIIKKHTAQRILLASDLPWQKTSDAIKQIEGLDLSRDEKEWIFSKSAQRLLGEL